MKVLGNFTYANYGRHCPFNLKMPQFGKSGTFKSAQNFLHFANLNFCNRLILF